MKSFKMYSFIGVQLSFMCLVVPVFLNNEKGAQLILFSTNKDEYLLHCANGNKNDESALAWTSKKEPAYSDGIEKKYLCQISKEDNCKNKFRPKGLVRNNLEHNGGYILDKRWEEFKEIETFGVTPTVLQNIKTKDFTLPFSVLIEKDGYLYLCDSKTPWNSKNCYFILLGAYGGQTVALRKCFKNEHFKKYDEYPSGTCWNFKSTFNETSLVSKTQWNHYLLTKQDNVINLFHYSRTDPILRFEDIDTFDVSHAVIRSKENGKWKLHNSVFLEMNTTKVSTVINIPSGPICVKIYVKPCLRCTITCTLLDDNDLDVIDKQSLPKALEKIEWHVITLSNKTNIYKKLKINIEVAGLTNESYYIGDIMNCASEDINVISTNNYASKCCTSIKYGSKLCYRHIYERPNNIKEDNTCPTYTFGERCFPCTKFDNCKQYETYCEAHSPTDIRCNCYEGYTCGTYRKCSKCEKGTYGRQCRYKCYAGCDDCDHISGNCITCKRFISSPENNCTSFDHPVLKNAPTILDVGYNYATIQIDFEYNGKQSPCKYEIQIYEEKYHPRWSIYSENNHYYEKSTENIPNLNPATKYLLRVVLITCTGEKEDRYEFVPIRNILTTCKDVEKHDINFETSQTSVTARINQSPETCPLEEFIVNTGDQNFTLNELKEWKRFHQQCHSYNLIIIKNEKTLFNYSIKTGDNSGEIVECLEVTTRDTEVLMTWNKRKDENDYIISFKYSNSRYQHCTPLSPEMIEEKVNEPKAIVKNLRPYSEYVVQIKDKRGGVLKSSRIKTNYSDEIGNDEMGNVSYSFDPEHQRIDILLGVNCEKVKGPMNVSLKLHCESDWCTQKVQEEKVIFSEYASNVLPLSLEIIGLTAYKLKLQAQRYQSTKALEEHNFMTNSTAPGPVSELVIYSKSESSLSLRWKPPYPPMGNLTGYYYVNKHSGSSIFVGITPCKLWKPAVYHCIMLTNLYRRTSYSMSIIPINDNHLTGSKTSISGFTEEEVPETPEFLNLIWNENYTYCDVTFPHPNITNGQIRGFQLYRNNTVLEYVVISNEVPLYTYRIDKYPLASVITIGVEICNKYCSSVIQNHTFTPPPKPTLNPSGIMITSNSTNIMLEISKMDIPESIECTLAVFFTEVRAKNPLYVETFFIKERQIVKESKILSNPNNLLARNSTSISDITIFHVGADSHLTFVPNTAYNITISLKNIYKDKSRSVSWSTIVNTLEAQSSSLNLLLLLLLIVPLIGGGYYLRSKGFTIKQPRFFRNRNEATSNITTNVRLQPMQPVRLKPKPAIYQNVDEALEENEYSKPIRIDQLESYIKECLENDEFEKQHALFPRGQTKPWNFGTKSENKSKNRYLNLAAYDHSRVRLNVINMDPNSEYINANYIDGYDCPKAYIATQGPKTNTINDFWRMIWQEQSEYIIMIANLVEGGKKKVAKYWPNINETLTFDEISVKYINVTVYANFEERVFALSSANEHRMVKQLHFISWPDHGVPMYAQSLGPFIKKILTLPQQTAPIVVHCSAGVGRTGTLILTDICLRMAAKQGFVDILYHQFKIREQRPNMVDNVEQYKLVHLLLLHCLLAPETSISCTENLAIAIEDILASKDIEKQMEYLEQSAWQDDAMRTTAFKINVPIVYEKNRFRNIKPNDYSRIILTPYPPSDESSMYINAIKVDGFNMSGRFIVTQYPLKNTVGDFWRLVIEQEITIAVCLNELYLNDDVSGVFFPTTSDSPLIPIPYLNITFVNKQESTYFNTYTLSVKNSKKKTESLKVIILQLKNWNYDKLCPENPKELVMLFDEMNRIGKNTERILISCYDGIRASGLYTSLCFLIEMMKLEQVCDVCLAVRTIRHSQQEFVREIDQFRFLYRSALEYVNMFEEYSNFRQ